jgi:hypothetical protein
MSVHPDYAKRFNQARDIRRILIRTATRPITDPDRERLSGIAADLSESAKLVKHGGYLIVILHWPEDPECGSEVYGPFKDETSQMEWAKEVIAAGEAGDFLLAGVHAIVTRMDQPFPVQR